MICMEHVRWRRYSYMPFYVLVGYLYRLPCESYSITLWSSSTLRSRSQFNCAELKAIKTFFILVAFWLPAFVVYIIEGLSRDVLLYLGYGLYMFYTWQILWRIHFSLTNRFQVAVRLFSNRSQMTSKCLPNRAKYYLNSQKFRHFKMQEENRCIDDVKHAPVL